jgi:hypothetical protein
MKLLQPSWTGPHLVAGVTPGIHHYWIKRQPPLQRPTSDKLSATQLTPLRLSFQSASQQRAITEEISSPAQATSQKLVGQRMPEA